MSVSSRENSLAESSISVSPRMRGALAGSSRSEPTAELGRALGRTAADQSAQRGRAARRRRTAWSGSRRLRRRGLRPGRARRRGRSASGRATTRRLHGVLGTTLKPSRPGQHHVQDDRVVLGRLPARERRRVRRSTTSTAMPSRSKPRLRSVASFRSSSAIRTLISAGGSFAHDESEMKGQRSVSRGFHRAARTVAASTSEGSSE